MPAPRPSWPPPALMLSPAPRPPPELSGLQLQHLCVQEILGRARMSTVFEVIVILSDGRTLEPNGGVTAAELQLHSRDLSLFAADSRLSPQRATIAARGDRILFRTEAIKAVIERDRVTLIKNRCVCVCVWGVFDTVPREQVLTSVLNDARETCDALKKDPVARREAARKEALENAGRILEAYLREVESIVGALLETEDYLESTRWGAGGSGLRGRGVWGCRIQQAKSG
eukprot:XP_001694865.1 predicted protein [Chlamydomonas reinhardtii]